MAFGLNLTNVRQPTVAMCPLVMSLYSYVFIIITSTVMIVCSSLTNNKWLADWFLAVAKISSDDLFCMYHRIVRVAFHWSIWRHCRMSTSCLLMK